MLKILHVIQQFFYSHQGRNLPIFICAVGRDRLNMTGRTVVLIRSISMTTIDVGKIIDKRFRLSYA
jgi:hypothetical protein